jgi:hypothetical protein
VNIFKNFIRFLTDPFYPEIPLFYQYWGYWHEKYPKRVCPTKYQLLDKLLETHYKLDRAIHIARPEEKRILRKTLEEIDKKIEELI